MQAIGRKLWAILEGYIPAWSHGPEPEFTSHETVCLLNVSDQEAKPGFVHVIGRGRLLHDHPSAVVDRLPPARAPA